MKTAIAVLSAAALFLLLDLVWLGYVAHNFYRTQLGPLMADTINIPAAMAFYVVFMAGVAVFVIAPAVTAGSWLQALIHGALFGFVTYATYDLTNLATVRGWPAQLAIVDLLWGTAVTAFTSAAGVAIAPRFA